MSESQPWTLRNAFASVYWYRPVSIAGRAGRAEYWLSWLGNTFLTLLLVALAWWWSCYYPFPTSEDLRLGLEGLLDEGELPPDTIFMSCMPLCLLLFFLAYCHLPHIALLCRRLHDVGLSEWWMLLLLCGKSSFLLGSALTAVGFSCKNEAHPEISSIIACLGLTVMAIGGLIWLGQFVISVLPSAAPNKWGCTEAPVSEPARFWSPLASLVTTLFHRYLNFRGRASRTEYWMLTLLGMLVWILAFALMIPTYALLKALGSGPGVGYLLLLGLVLLFFLIWLACIIPGLAVSVRRFHDVGLSGKWLLLVYGGQLLSMVIASGLLFGDGWWTEPLANIFSSGSLLVLIVSIIPSAGPNKWGEGPDGNIE